MGKQAKKAAGLFDDRPLKAGDHVLLGGTYGSLPGHWYLGTILCVDGEALYLLRSNQNGGTWHQEDSVHAVRAVGTIAELIEIKETARKAVAELSRHVDEIESELGRARAAVHNKLEELAKGGLKIAPLDVEASAAHDSAERAASQAYDEQEARESA